MAQASSSRVHVDNFPAPIRGDIVDTPNAPVDVINAARPTLSNGQGALDVMVAHPANQSSLEVVAPSPQTESSATTGRKP
ncbi:MULTISPECIES: hypothetical protein [Burkholderia]|uniref:hypothetical protein n=1 Tax=Burkholderia TaxID=32008 RepID=UPI000A4DF778|nr:MULTISPECIES: hypothetical protein [Burkholderia]NBI48806.1 hypothetical protein [Burkholderia sp. ISTR5]